MKASLAFTKLDRPPRRKPTRSNPSTAPTKDMWIAWRMKLGASRTQAHKLWTAYREWTAQEAQNGPVRVLKVAPWQDWEREFRAWLDEMPRKPVSFLARVAAAEKRRAAKEAIQARKAEGRKRFLRRYARHASPAQKIPRQAEHGTGGNDWAQGTRAVRGKADSGGSYAEVG